MGISSGLITFNKYLMHQDRFPFALGIGINLMISSVTMLQMMKQSNVVLVYVFSLALSLETVCRKRAATLALIFFATVLTLHGDLAFNINGFALQGTSMICE